MTLTLQELLNGHRDGRGRAQAIINFVPSKNKNKCNTPNRADEWSVAEEGLGALKKVSTKNKVVPSGN